MPTATRRCRRCGATSSVASLRLATSLTIWHEEMPGPQQVNEYVCIDRKACTDRLNDQGHRYKETDLWMNYHQNCRPRRYTARKYWTNGRRLTFAIAQALFMQAGHRLEKGRSDFPAGLKSGYIIDREWRYTSLLEAIKLIERPSKKSRCQRGL